MKKKIFNLIKKIDYIFFTPWEEKFLDMAISHEDRKLRQQFLEQAQQNRLLVQNKTFKY